MFKSILVSLALLVTSTASAGDGNSCADYAQLAAAFHDTASSNATFYDSLSMIDDKAKELNLADHEVESYKNLMRMAYMAVARKVTAIELYNMYLAKCEELDAADEAAAAKTARSSHPTTQRKAL